MAAIANVIVAALATTGCSDLRSSMPTSPTSTTASGAVVPAPTGPVVRTERWVLDLAMREVYGTGECDPGVGTTRRVSLDIEFRDNDSVAMQIESETSPPDRRAHWMGWIHGRGVEASGLAFERLPCTDTEPDEAGAVTLLTGYFSRDGQTFHGTEMRRQASPSTGELVYYFDWRARR